MTHTEKEIKSAEKKHCEDLRLRKKELARIEREAYERRIAFVKALDPAKAEPLIGPLAVYQMRHDAFLSGVTIITALEEAIDLTALLRGDILTNQYTTTPAYILLNYTLTPQNGCYHHYRGSTKELVHVNQNSINGEFFAMNDLYAILVALGYELTEEEAQWKDGTHLAYNNKPLDAFFPCA